MVEEVLVVGSVSAIIGLASGLVGAYLMHHKLDGEVEAELVGLRASFNRHLQGENSERGTSASSAARERRDEAMVKAMMAFKSGTPPADVIKTVAAEYPDVALWLAKKGLGL